MPDLTLAIVIIVLLVYAVILILLNKANILSKFNIEVVLGFLLMWRTTRGRKFINWLAGPKRGWTFWGNIAIVTVTAFGVGTFVLLLWEAVLVVQIPTSLAPAPQMLIGIPGLNPIIPVGYGIVALAIAILIHEFSHGILTRVAKVKIRSLGIIAVIIPIGAFVEPDEEGLRKLPRNQRSRLYAAGPMANLACAFVCALIFSGVFMAAVEPAQDGVVISGVTKDYPAYNAGLRPGMLITGISSDNFTQSKIVTDLDFQDLMGRTRAGDVINITYNFKGKTHFVEVKLVDKYTYYKKYYPEPKYEKELVKYKGVGFLGINSISLREDVVEAQARPFQHASNPLELFGYGLVYISLPLLKMSPMPGDITDLLVVNGPLGALPSEAFWILANLFYWLFWLNFMVGATNALPARPLDGGHIFKDGILKMLSKLRPNLTSKKAEKLADHITWGVAILVLFLIIWLVVGPYVAAGVRGLLGG
jgi:membrane-associated protease RseP (regulator of RpoE activity)